MFDSKMENLTLLPHRIYTRRWEEFYPRPTFTILFIFEKTLQNFVTLLVKKWVWQATKCDVAMNQYVKSSNIKNRIKTVAKFV